MPGTKPGMTDGVECIAIWHSFILSADFYADPLVGNRPPAYVP